MGLDDHKVELRFANNGFIVTFFNWEETDAGNFWKEKSLEVYMTLREAQVAIERFYDDVAVL